MFMIGEELLTNRLHVAWLWLLLSVSGPALAEDANAQARQSFLDASAEPVKSCEWKEIPNVTDGILNVSWREASKICEMASTSLGRQLPTSVFRHLLKASSLLSLKGAGETEKIAYQLMEIIDARGISDPGRMKDTLELAFKAYIGTNGRVLPRDLNVAIRKSGLGATLSDEGVIGLAAMISVQKRNNGE